MSINRKTFALLSLAGLVLTGIQLSEAVGQTAPIPRAVVPSGEAPEAMSGMFSQLSEGENSIAIPGAQWLQLQFADVSLGEGGELIVTSEMGQSQTFTQDQLEAYDGLTAAFQGSNLTVTLRPGEDGGSPTATIEDIIIGLPGQAPTADLESVAPDPLRELLGDDLQRFIPPDPPREPEDALLEAICGTVDDRTASNDPFAGRIVPIGCTGWLIGTGAVLTAGHCIGTATQTLEFNVPQSQANGTIVPAQVRDQYRIIQSSIVDGFTGVGNDWAVFRVQPNSETGLLPIVAQGGAFEISNSANPSTVRITGYGVDGPPPQFGRFPAPKNADNQTEQTHAGALTQNTTSGQNSATLRYTVDTMPANSGSPVIVEGGTGRLTIGIHTNGGCFDAGGANAGTGFRNAALWAAIQGIVRRGTGTAGTISQIKLAALDDDQVVAAMRDGDNNLRLIAWDVSPSGGLTRQGTGTAGAISQVDIVPMGDDRVVAGMRDGNGDLRLIVWDASSSGTLTRRGTGTAGGISVLALAPLSETRVVAAMRDEENNLRLIVWDVSANGSLTRRGTGTAGAISALDVVPIGANRVVTAMRDGDNNLRLIAWDVTSTGNLIRRGTGTAGTISQVALAALGTGRVVAAMRDSANDLRVIVWDVSGNGDLVRRGTGTAGTISRVAVSPVDDNTVATAMRDSDGNLRVITWNVSPSGEVTRGGTGTAGAISEVALDSADPERLVTAMRDSGNNLRLIVWDRE